MISSAIIEAGWEQMTQKFDAKASSRRSIADQVAMGLTKRITTTAISASLLCERGLSVEAAVLLRTTAEAFVNLCFIFHTGAKSKEDCEQLCRQFIEYGDVSYYKVLMFDLPSTKHAFAAQGLIASEIDRILADRKRRHDNAISTGGCAKDSWHKTIFRDMWLKVVKDPPGFCDKDLMEVLRKWIPELNSATHVDALSIQSHNKKFGKFTMAIVPVTEPWEGEAAALLAVSSWKAIGDVFSDRKWVDEMIEGLMPE